MTGETNLSTLLATMTPRLNEGEYVFCSINVTTPINNADILCLFHEIEGPTVILQKNIADTLRLKYSFTASWITLAVHSSLEAIGLTAAFSKALAEKGISCNVVSAFYHDHIFVPSQDADKAMETLRRLSVNF
ncbi:MAG: acetyltransferase [Chitinophagaceae bacterium]|nr:acetyltransferase [Chitinophagaceae bacterium]